MNLNLRCVKCETGYEIITVKDYNNHINEQEPP